MNRKCHIVAAMLLVIGVAAEGAWAARINTWAEAAGVAKRENKLIFAIYKAGKTGQSSDDSSATSRTGGVSSTGGSRSGLAIATTLSSVDVRPLVKKYLVVVHLRMGDQDSMWKKFETNGSPCLFATADGEFLRGISVDTKPEQFIAAFKAAGKRARELRSSAVSKRPQGADADTSDRAALLKEAERLIKKEDYPAAVSRVKTVLESADEESAQAKLAKRLAKTLTGRAKSAMNRAKAQLEANRALPGFRGLDEVAHLFAGLPIAEKAARELTTLMREDKYSDLAAEYELERKAYGLYDKGLELVRHELWKDAAAKFQDIVDRHTQSPVAKRAAVELQRCQAEMGRPAAEAK